MKENIEKLFEAIARKNAIHSKYLRKIKFYQEDEEEFDKLISYYIQDHISIEEQCDCYLLILNDTLEETKFFIENGYYRYSSFDEVKDKVYFNENYMKQYMIGLALSSYIWIAHIKVRKYFSQYLQDFAPKTTYFEIGPGHGEYFARAVKSSKFSSFYGLDISPTSCELTQKMVKQQVGNLIKKCEFLCQDFFTHNFNKKADLIVIGEVLEHVEKPLEFLKRSKELLNNDGEIFATIPINAPAIDHIYLFSHPDEVKNLIEKSGLKLKAYECFMANDYSLEKALKFKNAITMAVVLNA
ncbi:TPA: class I SAM-dependent methyltransferase [Campylobacter coli]|nr:class I SAM-dependent methyltransferase [Campylobacter coli]